MNDNSKPIQIGERVIGSTGRGRYDGLQFIGKFKGRQEGKGLLIKDEKTGKDVLVYQVRRIRINPQLGAEIEKMRQNPDISKAQVNKILEVTRGDIAGLKVGRRPDSKTVYVIHRGRRFDIDINGALSRQEKLGRPNPNIAKAMARKLNCPLCGEVNSVPAHEIRIKCSQCGFPLRRVRVKVR